MGRCLLPTSVRTRGVRAAAIRAGVEGATLPVRPAAGPASTSTSQGRLGGVPALPKACSCLRWQPEVLRDGALASGTSGHVVDFGVLAARMALEASTARQPPKLHLAAPGAARIPGTSGLRVVVAHLSPSTRG